MARPRAASQRSAAPPAMPDTAASAAAASSDGLLPEPAPSTDGATDPGPRKAAVAADPAAHALGMSNRSATGKKRHSGEVAIWNARLGWGFIRREDGGPDIFVHQRSITRSRSSFRSLLEGERVEFSERHGTQQGSSKGGHSRRLEAVDVSGPNLHPVIGQSPEISAAGEAPYFAVETVSPSALSSQGAASAAAGACGEASSTASGAATIPRARRPATALVPRAVARACASQPRACASQPPKRVPNRPSQKHATPVATKHSGEHDVRADDCGATNGAMQSRSGRDHGEQAIVEPACGDGVASMPSRSHTRTHRSSREHKRGVTDIHSATTEAAADSVEESAAASAKENALERALSIEPQHMKASPSVQPTKGKREKKARRMPA